MRVLHAMMRHVDVFNAICAVHVDNIKVDIVDKRNIGHLWGVLCMRQVDVFDAMRAVHAD